VALAFVPRWNETFARPDFCNRGPVPINGNGSGWRTIVSHDPLFAKSLTDPYLEGCQPPVVERV
jgi:hypothetical protein